MLNKPQTLTKDKLLREVRKRVTVDGKPVFTKKEIDILISALVETIHEMLVLNYKIRIENLGYFFCRKTNRRKAFDVNTNKHVVIPSRRVPTFKLTEGVQVAIRDRCVEYDEQLKEEESNNEE